MHKLDLSQPMARFVRAKEIWSTNQAELDAYVAAALTLHFVETPDGGSGFQFVMDESVSTERLQLIFADTMHNLRAALDYLAWQLVLASGNTPSERTCMPICTDQHQWRSAVPARLKGVDPKWISIIEEYQPFGHEAPNFTLFKALDDSNNLLKHRFLPERIVKIIELAVTSGSELDLPETKLNDQALKNGDLVLHFPPVDGVRVSLPDLATGEALWRIGFYDGLQREWDMADMIDWIEGFIMRFSNE